MAITPLSAKDYSVGIAFETVFKIDYTAAQKAVPLPPSEWILASRFEFRSTYSNIPMVRFYLLRHTNKSVTGAIRISTHKEYVDHSWGTSKSCSEKRRRAYWYFSNDAYDEFENCNIVYPLRGFNRRSKALKPVYRYIESHGLVGPNAWIVSNFARVKGDETLQVYYALPPENYGFPRERKYSNSESPWPSITLMHFQRKRRLSTRSLIG